MLTTHNLGLPRIGAKRELKFALEAYWKKETSTQSLHATAASLRRDHWVQQSHLDFKSVGDFSLYDQVLDMSALLGNLPARAQRHGDSALDTYFRAARGRSPNDTHHTCVDAAQMTKWFDTNYHYIVPEFNQHTRFSLHAEPLLSQIKEAQEHDGNTKPILIGPVTYLWLGRSKDQSQPLDLLERILPVYAELLDTLAAHGIEWVQLDEPALVTELSPEWNHAFNIAYHFLKRCKINTLLATYFGSLGENLQLACQLPVQGIHLDAVRARAEVTALIDWLPQHKIVSLGVVDGRNIWKSNLIDILDWLEPVAQRLEQRLWLAPSCSLLHVPADLTLEHKLDHELASWLAFAKQKLDEIALLAKALNKGRASVARSLLSNQKHNEARRRSIRVNIESTQTALKNITPTLEQRATTFPNRILKQQAKLNLPLFPTTTIGSFPQTIDIRKIRKAFKQGDISTEHYQAFMQNQIAHCLSQQEQLGLDVLVHGEPERNDMVEYFAEQLQGFVFSENGWVQSYGSRCVKPPIIYGDISRPHPMTIKWSQFANTLTTKPVKGMLTGPVTMLNWSFVRDDQPRETTCKQLALAIREEVLDLEKAGVAIIQIDEAALREGLPLRKRDQQAYLNWATQAFRISANGVADETQIHTHMCYSQFNDIIEAIASLDADVITIETSRSDKVLLNSLDANTYPNDIGPGVYDIHSPNQPNRDDIVELIDQVKYNIPAERIWINPDCGLKTRTWKEVVPALKEMVEAAKILRITRAA